MDNLHRNYRRPRYPIKPQYNKPQQEAPQKSDMKISWILGILFLILVIGIASLFLFFSGEETKENVFSGSNEESLEAIENPDSECSIQFQFMKIRLLQGVSSDVSVSGFQGDPEGVSWESENQNIASINQSFGSKVMIESEDTGSTRIIATDNAVSLSCETSLGVEVYSI